MNLILYFLTRPEAYIKDKIYPNDEKLHCWIKLQTHDWEVWKSRTFHTVEKCNDCGVTRRN